MKGKIRNLELDLIKKEENKITGYNSYSKIRELGTEEIKYYNSELGRVEIYAFFDNYGNSKEIIATNKTNIDKERRDFYNQRVVIMKAFPLEKTNKLLKIADKINNGY